MNVAGGGDTVQPITPAVLRFLPAPSPCTSPHVCPSCQLRDRVQRGHGLPWVPGLLSEQRATCSHSHEGSLLSRTVGAHPRNLPLSDSSVTGDRIWFIYQ